MKCFVVLSLAACSLAAPAADAEAQYLTYGNGLGLVGGVYAAAPAVGVAPASTVAVVNALPVAHASYAHALPAVTYAHALPAATYTHAVPAATYTYAAPASHVVAAPAVAAVKTVAAPVAHVAYAAPAYHVATAPVVHQIGYQVHHQVHHVPQVSVQKHTSTHTTHHVINHAPVIGAFSGVVPVASVPVVAAAPAEPAAAVVEA